MRIILIWFAIKYKGDWDAIYKALEEKEKVSLKELNSLENQMKDENWEVITILDIDYPNKMKEAYKPPFVLFMKGNKKLLSNKLLTTTGNQNNKLTKDRIAKFVPEMEKSNTLVVTTSVGADKEIIKHSTKGKIYVLDAGLGSKNIDFTEEDLLITEYPNKAKATSDTFRNRNRIIAALGGSLILFSSIKNGSINHLVTNFLNLGKEIYCFPGVGDDQDGNSELIKQGANLITEIKDISN